MSIANIKTQIVTALEDMGSLKEVFDFETANPSGYYPFATVTLRDGDGEFASTAHNHRRHGFWIRVYQEQSNQGQGVSKAEDIAQTVMDEMIAHFDRVTTLSGVCKYVEVVDYDCSYVDRELDTRFLEVKLDAHEIVSAS